MRRDLLALGAPGERVLVTGNLKYDLAEPRESPLSAWLEAELGKSNRGPVLSLPGACLPMKKMLFCGRLRKSSANFPRALLILAPRKPEQFDNAAAIVASRDENCCAAATSY